MGNRRMRRRCAAVAAGLLVAACSSGDRDAGDGVAAPVDDALGEGVTAAPTLDWYEVPLVADGVRDGDQRWVPTGAELTGGKILLAFERPDVEPGCIGGATLEATITTDGDPFRAWVSLEDGLVDMAPGAALGNGVIARGSPSAAAQVDGELMSWDVAELVRWSIENQATDPHLVLVLEPDERPYEYGLPGGFAASEGGRGPTLRLAEGASCGQP